jgi:bacteriocin-like protein
MNKELLKGLSEEQIAKVKACKNSSEVLALAKAEGIELTDEQLNAISGGGACSVISDIGDYINPNDCPRCGSNNLKDKGTYYICQSCGYKIENYD